MTGPGRSFSLVDRIDALERGPGGHSLRGTFRPALGLRPSLLAEAVGQLAAWGAMAELGFERRPVAGLCSGLVLGPAVKAGEELELHAALESVDAEALTYSGCASLRGETCLELEGTVGPMVPLAEFEDPAEAQARFDALRRGEPGASGLAPISPPQLLDVVQEVGRASARLVVPREAPYYADHFPRRAVFPGTLLLEAELELARCLLDVPGAPGEARPGAQRIEDVKLRAFLEPGDELELSASWEEAAVGSADHARRSLRLEARRRGRSVAGATLVRRVGAEP